MGKKIIAVNAGPRMGWNTETLIKEASKGAESAGAVVWKCGSLGCSGGSYDHRRFRTDQ